MSEPDELQALAAQLKAKHIRDRQAAIQRASELLARDERRQEVRALLQEVAQDDAFGIVRDAAQKALDADERSHRERYGALGRDAQHMFGVRCPKGHITYFDKREVCGSQRWIVRSTDQLDVLRLPCGACDEVMEVEVDCEGYK